jgi:hypothetical protein
MTHMGMVRVQLSMIQLMVHSSRVELMVVRSMKPMMELMARMIHKIRLRVHNSSKLRMEMVHIQRCMIQLMTHMNRVQSLVLHNNQSKILEMVRMQCILGLVRSRYSIERMVKEILLRYMKQLIHRRSREIRMVRRNIQSMMQLMVHMKHMSELMASNRSMICMEMVRVQFHMIQ